MIGTLSVSSASHAHNHERVLHKLSCQANIGINLMCSRIYDAFDQKPRNISSLFHVFMFIILYSLKVIFSFFDRLLRFSLLTVLLR